LADRFLLLFLRRLTSLRRCLGCEALHCELLVGLNHLASGWLGQRTLAGCPDLDHADITEWHCDTDTLLLLEHPTDALGSGLSTKPLDVNLEDFNRRLDLRNLKARQLQLLLLQCFGEICLQSLALTTGAKESTCRGIDRYRCNAFDFGEGSTCPLSFLGGASTADAADLQLIERRGLRNLLIGLRSKNSRYTNCNDVENGSIHGMTK
jgi:hypothetical protein